MSRKMKNWKMNINRAVLLLSLIMIGTISNAQRGRHDGYRNLDGQRKGNRPNNQNVKDQLELTDDQKEKIEEIKLVSGKESIQRRNMLRELEAQLTTSLTQENVEQKKANSIIDEIGKLKTEIRKNQVDTHLKIRELLTDRQKLIFDQRQYSRFGHWDHRN
jgi:Spy/CpxP family protein refolding chaperone